MLRLGAAACAGAGLSLAAVYGLQKVRSRREVDSNEEADHSFSAAQSGREQLHVNTSTAGKLRQNLERDSTSDWGSPVLPRDRDVNNTISPSKLPRPRKLFAERDQKSSEVRFYQ